ncbi:dimethylhistidine N-methyltransferase [Halopseudomonas xinjiangensis]|uniref:Dimethylhistidine N-methyltransferase n=1 Tax=Halopseudomonas xinjiangensis TaxID=487184 RepID=A0A1H1VNR4_9GAMM|nr:L-histidine N(alpha)-methyltransferase [Halopseudomonas xinjiangensis]SDS86527.1 dimethylhistidine N-methyltransferase [Halopseudomonas xinjiangensis]
MNIALPSPRIETIIQPDPSAEKAQLLSGLLSPQARIDPKYFYDDLGCELFTRICELDEYYPTRTEAGIFEDCRDEISTALPSAAQWVDLGCGDCAKSARWLDHVAPTRLVGVDIAGDFLQSSLTGVAARYPRIDCVGVVSDFTQSMDIQGLLAEKPESPPVFFYPGSSIGNFDRPHALRFLRSIRQHCGADGRLLIGVDLVKDRDILEAAYDDAQGVTAAFNLHVLEVVNRELGADFDPDRFRHRALFDSEQQRIEMQLVARREQAVHFTGEATRHFAEGEHVLTEYSHKYTIDGFGNMLREAGFGRYQVWTDANQWFGVFLAEPI